MTYLVKKRPVMVQRRRRAGLAGFFDTPWDYQDPTSKQCLDQANQQTAPFDAKIDDLSKNWNPTGFYTPDDIRKIVSQALATVQQGQAAINQAAAEPNASQDSVMRATDDLARAGSRSLDYLQAATQADQQGVRVVNAPGLKRWVTDTMASASSAMVTAAVIGCITPWWVDALAAFQVVFDKAWSAIKMILGAALAIGELALKVPATLDDLLPILKWGLGLGAAAYIIYHLDKAKKAGASIL